MFTKLLALTSVLAFVRADPTPLTPPQQQVGGTCTFSWQPDTSGVWTTMYVELMAGSNKAMQHLTTVGTVDGTDANNTTFTYTCPDVSPNADIYFYQISSPYSTTLWWSTRFTIAGASGTTVPPPNKTEPDGTATPWGSATLGDPAAASPAPTDVGSRVSGASASASSGTPSSGASTSGASTSSGATSGQISSTSGSSPTVSGAGLGPSAISQVSVSKSGSPSSGTSSAGTSKPTNGAIAVRDAPLYGLGVAAAMALFAL